MLPQAEDDQATTEENTPVEIDVLDNDSNIPTEGTLTVTDPANGTATVNDNGTPDDPSDDTVTYDPDTDFSGEDSFEYTVCDASDNCDTATVTVTVEEVAGDDSIIVFELITPNQDGRNDFLFIQNVDKARNNSLKIFNRWGVAVYEGINYNNQNNVFDGRSRGRSTLKVSDYLPSGVYFYIFEYELNQRKTTQSGYLYLGNK